MRCFHVSSFDNGRGRGFTWEVGPVDTTHRLDVFLETSAPSP